MKYFNACLLAVVLLMLSACAASGPGYTAVHEAIPALDPAKGRIFFYRLNPVLAANSAATPIVLNDREVGESRKGGFFFVDMDPGPVSVSTETEVSKKLSFAVVAGQIRYVRTSTSLGFFMNRVYPELVDRQTGETELAETVYLGRAAARNR